MTRVVRALRARPWLTATGVVILVAACAGGYLLTGRTTKATAAPTYRLVAVTTGTIRQSVAATGAIEPAVQDALTFSASGQVTSVDVKAGQTVAQGATLATINSAALQASLAQAQASLASDQARVTADTNAAGSATQLAADNAAVSAASGQVTAARAALAGATLTSPIAGLVASVGLTPGQQVSGSAGSSSGSAGSSGSSGSASGGGGSGTGSSGTSSTSSSSSADILVVSTNSWVVNATVDDTQVGLLAVGDQAQLTVDGTSGTVYGTVSSIGLIPSSTSGVASYPVTIGVTGSPAGLHAGASVTVSLIYKQLTDVLVVPTTAVHVVSGKQVVYEMSGTKQVAHPVSIGLASGGSSEVLSGVASGDQVVVPSTRTGAGRTGGTGATGRTGTGGGFGGGGFGGGGFGGGTGTTRTGTGG